MTPFIKPYDFEHYDLPASWHDDRYETSKNRVKIIQSINDAICFAVSCIILIGLIALIASTGRV